ncbi:aldo-keto reductase family 1 member A1-A-like [Sycon ciliatum]|uniref:aldo-keto reductase family 1 member A1-A-like n=1 Tax=Sycon ciliatum TaxID=27933 RepID=UPI0031F61AAD
MSNYEQNHRQDIIDMKELLPLLNQVEYHPYCHENDLIKFCQERNITFNGYTPMSCPDYAPSTHGWSHSTLQALVVMQIVQVHSADPSQVLLAWELAHGVVANRGTRNPDHMTLNLQFEKVKLSTDDIAKTAAIVPPEKNKVFPDRHQYK